jgi:hypothetical protein
MPADPRDDAGAARTAALAAFAGLLALASAMGIGRFAFTPMLPLMQAAERLTLAQGAWLALANYLGYLAGALGCSLRAPAPATAARAGLVAVAVLTLGMALPGTFVGWIVLRFAAGVASAFVLVGVAAAVLGALAVRGRSHWAGRVFAGVGIGIAIAGLLGQAAGLRGWPPEQAWLGLGLLACGVLPFVWRPLQSGAAANAAAAAASPARRPLGRAGWRIVAVYGGFGVGYIVPATFLPAAARALVADPAVFGSVWPVFGVAAAVSTLLVASVFRAVPPRRVWAVSQIVMAVGVLVTAVSTSLAALLVCAVCVGGTFVVATMAGLQEARRLAGNAAAPRWIAAMTAAFATGQLLGPLGVGLLSHTPDAGMAIANGVAGAALLAGAFALWRAVPAPDTLVDLPAAADRTTR